MAPKCLSCFIYETGGAFEKEGIFILHSSWNTSSEVQIGFVNLSWNLKSETSGSSLKPKEILNISGITTLWNEETRR
jgi:hypothetical protein